VLWGIFDTAVILLIFETDPKGSGNHQVAVVASAANPGAAYRWYDFPDVSGGGHVVE
jgi:hypothetical protein